MSLHSLTFSCCPSELQALIGACSLLLLTSTKFPAEVTDKEMTKYIGIDVGKKRCHAWIADGTDSVLDEFSFRKTTWME
jgi:hypothetical protein